MGTVVVTFPEAKGDTFPLTATKPGYVAAKGRVTI
jgi:hypothetical protein